MTDLYLQILIFISIYFLGLFFIFLFYPRVPYYLCVTSGLFWGSLIYIFSAILLGLFGIYSWLIWLVLAGIFLFLVILNLKRRNVYTGLPWGKAFLIFAVMAGLSALLVFILGGNQYFLATTDSLSYIVFSTHFYNGGSVFIPGANYFLRGGYGISEIVVHALAGFISKPFLTLWHPLLFISLYSTIASIYFRTIVKLGVSRLTALLLGFVVAVWTGTASMNWFNSFYIHIHMFTAFCMLLGFYFYWKVTSMKEEASTEGFLGALAVSGYALSRTESPVAILLFLSLMLVSKKYTRKEKWGIFSLPIVVIMGWQFFLLNAYEGTDSVFWPDNRILLAEFAYIAFCLILLVWDKLKLDNYRKYFSKALTLIILLIPIILSFFRPGSVLENTYSIMFHLFGGGPYTGIGIWIFYMIGGVLLLLTTLAINKPWKKSMRGKLNFNIILKMITAYFVLLLFLGFVRNYQTGGRFTYRRWGDSASRMISHIAPSIGLFTSLKASEVIFTRDSFKKHSK